MSEAEILAEQRRLLESLNPDLVKFLTNKRNIQPDQPMEEDTREEKEVVDLVKQQEIDIKEEDKSSQSDVIDVLRRYPNMNQDEPDKREWMSDIPQVMLKEWTQIWTIYYWIFLFNTHRRQIPTE